MGKDSPAFFASRSSVDDTAAAAEDLQGNKSTNTVPANSQENFSAFSNNTGELRFLEDSSLSITGGNFTNNVRFLTIIEDANSNELFFRTSNPPNTIHRFDPALPIPNGGGVVQTVENLSGSDIDVQIAIVFRTR